MSWTSSFILVTWHESRYIHHSSNCHDMFWHIFREYINKHITFIFQFSARVSDNTNIINGLNTIHGYQTWRMMYDERYTYGSTNMLHYFQSSRCPSCEYLKIFYGNTSPVNWWMIQKPANLRLGLCVRWNFFTSDFWAYRFWANVDIYMLVIPVDSGPIWSIIKVETAELLGDFRSVTLVVYQL